MTITPEYEIAYRICYSPKKGCCLEENHCRVDWIKLKNDISEELTKAKSEGYRAGQEYMRKEAQRKAESLGDFLIADAIAALPILELEDK